MLVKYQDHVVGVMGATQFGLVSELERRPVDDVDRRRVMAVCDWALDVRHQTGYEPGRLPDDQHG